MPLTPRMSRPGPGAGSGERKCALTECLGREEVCTYGVFGERGESGGTVSVEVGGVLVHYVVRAHVGVIEAVPMSRCVVEKKQGHSDQRATIQTHPLKRKTQNPKQRDTIV